MNEIEFFKSQAKKFYKDYKTGIITENGIYEYSPKYFDDIDDFMVSYDIDEKSFTLMQAQHIIALHSGFKSWNDLIHSSPAKLELGRLLLIHRNDDPSMGPLIEQWEWYKTQLPKDLGDLSDEGLLSIFKAVFLNIID